MHIFSSCPFIWTHHAYIMTLSLFIAWHASTIISFNLSYWLLTLSLSLCFHFKESIICISNKASCINKSLEVHDITCIHAILSPHTNLILLNNIMHLCIHLIIITIMHTYHYVVLYMYFIICALIHAFHNISTKPIISTAINLKATLKGESRTVRIWNGRAVWES